MNVFEPFIISLLEQSGFIGVQISVDIIEETLEVFMDRLITELTMLLEDDDKVIFLELIENNEDTLNSAFEFVKMKVNDYEDNIERIMDVFAKEYLSR